MKIKLVDSCYDETTGMSYAKINTDYGEFEGWSRLHDEDRYISSSFCGCQYAEMRAIMQYMKYRIKLLNERIISLENLKKIMQGKKDYDHNSVENRTIRKQIYILNKERVDWKERLTSLSQRMIDNMNQREKIIKKITHKGDETE